MDLQVVQKLALALALGLIVGAERGWQARAREEGRRVVGLRTFGLVGLLGGVAAVLAEAATPWLLVVVLGGVIVFVCTAYAVNAPRTEDFGATTELAVVLTFALGALAAVGHAAEAAAAAVVTAGLLGAKPVLHRWIAAVEREELYATLQLLLIAVVVLPLLPDRGFGPWDAVNPRTLGLFVLLVAGISFVGYVAVKVLGARMGLLLTAFFGGLTSSTAVTVAFARMARRDAARSTWLAAGIGIAAATMAPRLLVEVAAVERSLVPALLAPLAALALVPLAIAAVLSRRAPSPSSPEGLELRNPLQLGPAVVYGAALALVFVLVRAADAWLGEGGVYLLAALSGLTDVDAVSLSMARMAPDALDPTVAARAIVVAALANTAVKATLAAALGGRRLGVRVAWVLGPTLVVSAGVAALTLR